jgi:hypothetical protein
MARDRVRLRRTLARNLARQARRETPSRSPTPTPSRPPSPTPQPAATPPASSRLPSLQRRLDVLTPQIMAELTPTQRSRAGKFPKPEAVESIAPGVAGRSTFPIGPGRVAGAIHRGVQVVQALSPILSGRPPSRPEPARFTRVSLEATKDPPGKILRHEIGHQVLGSRGIRRSEQEAILKQAKVPGTTTGVNFRLLQSAASVHLEPSASKRQRLNRERFKLVEQLTSPR